MAVDRVTVLLKVNGKSMETSVWPMARLLDVLREQVGLTGAKEGCGEGECGACSVLLDGRVVNSCLIPAVQAAGAEITTIEGDAPDPVLRHLQDAFIECNAAQCGICTPGMIMACKALLDHNQSPSEDEIRTAISGNLCRCTGYTRIIEACRVAAVRTGGHL